MKKTNVIRYLDQKKIVYQVITYTISDGLIDGISVARKIGLPPGEVFKTLVLIGASKNYYVALLPVDKNLNLKAVAKHFNEKKIDMIHVKDLQKITGYLRGGCSPFGMKKQLPTLVDETIKEVTNCVLSAGKKGLQIKMNAHEFVDLLGATIDKIAD